MKKKSAALMLLALCAFLLTGCASDQEAAPFTVMILDTYIDPAAVDAYAAALPEELGAKVLQVSAAGILRCSIHLQVLLLLLPCSCQDLQDRCSVV